MMKDRITLENITELKKNEIFVFGSNQLALHGAGAAKLAAERFGAVDYIAFGASGQSFAIPTKDRMIQTLEITKIRKYVEAFIQFVKVWGKENTFLVTEIGCGLAGYKPEDIAPLFKEAVKYDNIHLPKRFWDILNK